MLAPGLVLTVLEQRSCTPCCSTKMPLLGHMANGGLGGDGGGSGGGGEGGGEGGGGDGGGDGGGGDGGGDRVA